jgi:hypothetical protein
MPPKPASSRGRGRPLIGRAAECGELDSLLEALRRGESRSLVIRGEAGVGKTALLGYLTEQAADCRVISVTAVQWEMELAFAALHQLCAPVLDELDVLPGRSVRRWGSRSGCARVRCRTGSWSAWRC